MIKIEDQGISFSFQAVSANHLLHLLSELNGSKATGVDDISSRFLKASVPALATPLARLILIVSNNRVGKTSGNLSNITKGM